ncbi:MAG TPA: response regulator [Rhodanobacteraceae bacterium]
MNATESQPVHILLVEDETMLCEFMAESLRESGFDVHAVCDGNAGLDVLQGDKPVDLLLSDVRLPGHNGYELAETGKALRPELKVVLMTGYAPTMPPELTHIVHRVLQKPFKIDSLPGVITAALAERGGVARLTG